MRVEAFQPEESDWQIHHAMLRHICKIYKPKSYLEIGVQAGNSLRIVLDSTNLEKLYLSDTWGNQYGGLGYGNNNHIKEILEEKQYSGSITFLDGFSQETIPQVEEKFDLVTVDGDHSYEGAMKDLENCWKILNPKGILLFDDVTHPNHTNLYNCAIEFFKTKSDIKILFVDTIRPNGVFIFQKND